MDGPMLSVATLLLLVMVVYLLPTWVAIIRGKRAMFAILVLNVLLGWSLIGWIVALVWSLTPDRYQEWA